MSIPASPGDTITAEIDNGEPGKLGDLQVGLLVRPDTWVVALTTSGITEEEVDESTSSYAAEIAIPSVADATVATEVVWVLDDLEVGSEPIDWNDDDTRLLIDLTDVAALLHARTNVMATEVGTFNDDTRPTGEQVHALIAQAAGDVASRIGRDIPPKWITEAKRLVALRAAALVESSFFPQHLDTDQSAYRQYTAMYLSGVERLTAAIGLNSIFLA